MNDNGFVKTMSLPGSHNAPDELPFSEPNLSPVTDRPAAHGHDLHDWTDEDMAIWKTFYDLEPWPETLEGLDFDDDDRRTKEMVNKDLTPTLWHEILDDFDFGDDELDQEDWVDSDDRDCPDAEDDVLSQYGLMVDGRLLDFCEARDICEAVDLMFMEQLQSYDGPGQLYVVNLTEMLRE